MGCASGIELPRAGGQVPPAACRADLFALCACALWLGVLASGCDDAGPTATSAEPAQAADPKVVDPKPSTQTAQEAPVATQTPVAEPEPPPRLYARKYVSRVWSQASLESEQLGYMRAGALATAKTAEPVGHDRCRRGWYELQETGGFVCDGREVTAFRGDKLPDVRPSQPDRGAALPYLYAYTTRSGTPMYKRLPTREEAMFWEEGRLPDGTIVDAGIDAGGARDAGDAATEPARPRPPTTLEALRGERGALVRRTLQGGFYVSLDRELERDGRPYWRTMSSGHVAAGRLKTIEGSMFEGVPLAPGPHPKTIGEVPPEPPEPVPTPTQPPPDSSGNTSAPATAKLAQPAAPGPAHPPPLHLPLGYVVSGKTPRYTRTPRGALRLAKQGPAYHQVFEVVGRERARGRTYVRDADGFLYRADHIRLVELRERPKGVSSDERWLDIDLGQQTLVAYEGEIPVRATLISSGRARGGPHSPHFHATPAGTYRILSKHVSTTMDGDHAVDGPYSLEDVPYVQFFQGALALHSAFWHNRFGRPSSHGCINLPPKDAQWLFEWTLPKVPTAWHAAYPPTRTSGTLLRIHGETPPG